MVFQFPDTSIKLLVSLFHVFFFFLAFIGTFQQGWQCIFKHSICHPDLGFFLIISMFGSKYHPHFWGIEANGSHDSEKHYCKETVMILSLSLSTSYSSLFTHGRQSCLCWCSGLRGAAFLHFRSIALCGERGITANKIPSDDHLERLLLSF